MSSFSNATKKIVKTVSHNRARICAFTLALAMCFTAVGTHLFGLLPNIGFQSVDAYAAGIFSSSDRIYDSGTIDLDAYYGSNNAYHAHDWKVDNIVSQATGNYGYTIADASDVDVCCFAEAAGHYDIPDSFQGHQIVDYGTPAAGAGEKTYETFYYVAEGTPSYAADGTLQISWKVKAWNKEKADAHNWALPITQDAIETEWNSGVVYSGSAWVRDGGIFGAMAPEWESGNEVYDAWQNYKLDYGVIAEYWVDESIATPEVRASLYTRGAANPDFPLSTGGIFDDIVWLSTDSDTDSMPYYYGGSAGDITSMGGTVNVYGLVNELLFEDMNFEHDLYYMDGPDNSHHSFAYAQLQNGGTAYRIYNIHINTGFSENGSDKTVVIDCSPSAFQQNVEVNTNALGRVSIAEAIGHVGDDGTSSVFVSLSYDRTSDVQRAVGDAHTEYPVTIDTTATDDQTHTHQGTLDKDAGIDDVITFTGLNPAFTYRVDGSLHTADGSLIAGSEVSHTLTATEITAGTYTMHFELDSRTYADQSVVAYEKIYVVDGNDEQLVISHEDANDDDQTVTYPTAPVPTLSTTATCNGSHTIPGTASNVTIDDVITFTNLDTSVSYTIRTVVADKADGQPVSGISEVVTDDFQPSTSDGTVTVQIPFDASQYQGKSLVVFEYLYDGNTLVASHEDVNDAAQTVSINVLTPSLTTSVAYLASGTTFPTGTPVRAIPATATQVTCIDRVTYQDLALDDYTLVTEIWDKDSNTKVLTFSDTPLTNTSTDGFIDVSMQFDASQAQGHSYVVFEYLYRGANNTTHDAADLVVSHTDINDAAQTIVIESPTPTPTLSTVATYNNAHVIPVSANTVTVSDAITFTGLDTTVNYTIRTVVMDKSTGQAVAGIDEVITNNFRPTAAAGTTTVNITFDASQYRGKTFVIFEYLMDGTTEVANHTDINDVAQTLTLEAPPAPTLTTVATDVASGTHTLTLGASQKINDSVSYTNVIPNTEYRLHTTLWDATGNKAVSEIQAVDTTFTPAAATGTIDVTIDVSSLPAAYRGHNIVVYQELYQGTTLVADHKTATDTNQTVTVPNPTLSTSAFFIADMSGSTQTRVREVPVGTSVLLSDELTYSGLIANQAYIVKSWAIDKVNGNRVTDVVTSNFTASAASGSVTVQVPANTSLLAGKTIVMYEQIFIGDTLIVQHVDVNDSQQTLTVANPTLTTVATSGSNGTHTLNYSANETINDVITFTGFTGNVQYTVVTSVYVRGGANNRATDIAEKTSQFTMPANGSGTFTVSIPVNATAHAGQTLVVYEIIKDASGNIVAQHVDINDDNQAVTVGQISTVLTGADLSSKSLSISGVNRAVDTITYSGLTPGVTYVITGQIVDRETLTGTTVAASTTVAPTTAPATSEQTVDVSGQTTTTATPTPTTAPARTIPADGVLATATMEFTPTAASGTVRVNFDVDTTGLSGHHLVCYETISVKGNSNGLVAEHKDLNDANQTVTVKSTAIVQTGVNNSVIPYVIIACVLFAAFVGFGTFAFVSTKKKSTKPIRTDE